MNGIGERLKQIRIERKITQDEIWERTGIPKSSLSRYENNETDPSIETVKKLAKYFDVSIDWLTGVSDIRKVIEFNAEDVEEALQLLRKLKEDDIALTRLMKYYEAMKEVFDGGKRL